jgi:hypothetical protein
LIVVDDNKDDDESYKEATEKAKSNKVDLSPNNKTINNNNKRQLSNLDERMAETNIVFEEKEQRNELEERRISMDADAKNQKLSWNSRELIWKIVI